MVLMKPGRACIESHLVGFACATNATEVEDKLERNKGVLLPCLRKKGGDLGRGGVGDDLKEEINAGICRRGEGSRLVLCQSEQGGRIKGSSHDNDMKQKSDKKKKTDYVLWLWMWQAY